jgi:cell division inhibitor SepF
MSIWQGFKSIFVGEDEIEQEEYASYRPPVKTESETVYQPAVSEEIIEEPAAPAPQPKSAPRPVQNRSYSRQNSQQRARDVKMSTTSQSSFDLVLARPNNYRDVNAIGDDLNAGKTVILNLEMVKQDDATRILDFLSGVAYANDDEIKMMAQKTYAIMPSNVNFSGVDLVSELESNGYNF